MKTLNLALLAALAAGVALPGIASAYPDGISGYSGNPAVRARTTAEIFWKVLGAGELSQEQSLAPGAHPEPVTTLLGSLSDSEAKLRRLLVVGHMPDLAVLLHHLANGRVSASVSFPPGGMSRLDFAATVRAHAGSLVWSYKPAELAVLEDANLV
jgi:phosphohistidine phosphatase SixA